MKSKTFLLAGALRALAALPFVAGAAVPATSIAAPAATTTPAAGDLAKTIAATIHSALLANPATKTPECIAAVNQDILESGVTPAVAADALVLTRPLVIAASEMTPPINECLTRSLQLAQNPPASVAPGAGGNGGAFGSAPQSNGGGGGGTATYLLPNRG